MMASGSGGNANNADNTTIKFDERSSTSTSKTQTHIEQILEKAVKRFRASIRYSQFVKNYPDIYKKDADCLKIAYEQFTEKLTARILGETQQLLEEDNVNGLLEELDRISKTAKSETAAWRPSGIPEKDVKPHLTAVKLEHRERLRRILDDLETKESLAKAENAALSGELNQLRIQLDEQLLKFESATSVCRKLPTSDITRFISSCDRNTVDFERDSEMKDH